MTPRLAEISRLTSCVILTGCSGRYSVLEPAGPAAQSVYLLWWGMFTVGSLVLITVCALWWYAVGRSKREYPERETQTVARRLIWAGGIALPTVSIAVLLIFGIPAGHKLLPAPDPRALRIDVHARQWFWQVTYPQWGIQLTDELHIPINTPIDIYVTSKDVIHGFWVPRLGGKIDAIPGRTNIIRLEAGETGNFGGQCAEYCGRAHALMKFSVIAHTADDFEAWVNNQTRER